MDVTILKTDRRSAVIDLAVVIGAAIILIDVLSIGPGTVVGGSIGLKLLFLSRMILLLLLATWRLRSSGYTWSDVGLKKPALWRCIIAVAAGLLVIVLATAASKAMLLHAGYPPPNYSAFAPLRGNLAEYLFWMVPVTIGSAAFGEEMIFRGFILGAFERLLGGTRWATLLAIVLQATVFSLLHAYQGVGAVSAGIVGLIIGFVWWGAKRNLWPGIIIHLLLDGSAMTAIYFGMA